MFYEKLDLCPHCGSDLDQTEYDGQFCRGCETGPDFVHADDLAVDRFSIAMKAKLRAKRLGGAGGWNDREACTAERLSILLREHVDKGDPVDVANFAMMLHQRGERIEREKSGVQVGIELATKWVEKRRDDYIAEHGFYDYTTGVTEFPGTGEEMVGEWDEIIEGIRAIGKIGGAS